MIRGYRIVTEVISCVDVKEQEDKVYFTIHLDWLEPGDTERGYLTLRVCVSLKQSIESSMFITAQQGNRLEPVNIKDLALVTRNPDIHLNQSGRETLHTASERWDELFTSELLNEKWKRHSVLLKMRAPIRTLLADDLHAFHREEIRSRSDNMANVDM